MEKKMKMSKIFGLIGMGISFLSIFTVFLPIIKMNPSLSNLVGMFGGDDIPTSFSVFSLFKFSDELGDLGEIAAFVIALVALLATFALFALVTGILSIFNKKGTRITSTVFAFLNLCVAIGVLVLAFVAKSESTDDLLGTNISLLVPAIGSYLIVVAALIVAVMALMATIFCPSKAALAEEAMGEDMGMIDDGMGMYNSGDTVNLGNNFAGQSGLITFLSGSCAGYQIPVNPGEEILIGKDPSQCSVVIGKQYAKVSRKHCGVRYDQMQGVYLVTDYSTNGTNIVGGGKLLANSTSYLERGTTINLAHTENSFRLD